MFTTSAELEGLSAQHTRRFSRYLIFNFHKSLLTSNSAANILATWKHKAVILRARLSPLHHTRSVWRWRIYLFDTIHSIWYCFPFTRMLFSYLVLSEVMISDSPLPAIVISHFCNRYSTDIIHTVSLVFAHSIAQECRHWRRLYTVTKAVLSQYEIMWYVWKAIRERDRGARLNEKVTV